MAFRFPLQSVLRLRKSLENQEEKKLMSIAAAAGQVRSEIERLRVLANAQEVRHMDELNSGGALGAMLQFHAECRLHSRNLQAEHAKKLAEIERRRREQAEEYKRARQKREILEGLRDHQKAQFEAEAAQQEQVRMDEAFLMRMVREEQE